MDQRDPIMQYFDDTNDNIFMPTLSSLAGAIHDQIPRNPERTIALRKLLECRDAINRALATGRAEYLINEGKEA